FISTLEKAVRSRDGEAANQLFDQDAILARLLAGIELSAAHRKSFISGFKGRAREVGLGRKLILKGVGEGGSYKFLRIHRDGDQKRPRFRLLGPGNANEGVNYHDFLLERGSDGR